MRTSPSVLGAAIAAALLVGACASASEPDAAPSADVSAPDELALTETGDATGVIDPDDIPAGVDPGPTSDELEAEEAENRPDVEPGLLAMENADHSFEARYVDGTLSGSTGSLSVELGSMVAVSLVTDVTDSLVIDDLDLAAATNGDAAQLVFVAEEAGTFPVRLRSSGLLVAELVVG